jgi:hypothetical protein
MNANAKTLLPHQQRVVVERDELNDKFKKLSVFLKSEKFESVNPDEQKRLRRQHFAMFEYRSILEERISYF